MHGSYADCDVFGNNTAEKVHVSSLAWIPTLWSLPHYRSKDYRDDLLKNLKNVALPHTGLALSKLCYFRWVAMAFLTLGYPLVCVAVALHEHSKHNSQRASTSSNNNNSSSNSSNDNDNDNNNDNKNVFAETFHRSLLCPRDWFSIWQLNCRLASLHSHATHATGYALENKWTFLKAAKAAGMAASPFFEVEKLVVKNANVEGGLGEFFDTRLYKERMFLRECEIV